MNMKENTVKLSNGLDMSNLCMGTGIVYWYMYGIPSFKRKMRYWIKNIIKDHKQLKKDVSLSKVIDTAMKNGCNCFDTSRAYCGAEYILGKTLKKYKRNDFFLVTKLCNADQYKGNIKDAFEKSICQMGVDYVDLYLMHWPVEGKFVESWKQMEKLYREGKCRAIGVCNCNIHHLEKLQRECDICPMVNQFECHPLFTQDELREYCNNNGIQVMAYTSTARMDERLKKTVLIPIAKKYEKSVAQVILRWHQQIGNIPIVNSTNVKHFEENTKIYDFSLDMEEIKEILAININSRLRYDPDNCDFTQL